MERHQLEPDTVSPLLQFCQLVHLLRHLRQQFRAHAPAATTIQSPACLNGTLPTGTDTNMPLWEHHQLEKQILDMFH
jgi:hypothetical protein